MILLLSRIVQARNKQLGWLGFEPTTFQDGPIPSIIYKTLASSLVSPYVQILFPLQAHQLASCNLFKHQVGKNKACSVPCLRALPDSWKISAIWVLHIFCPCYIL